MKAGAFCMAIAAAALSGLGTHALAADSDWVPIDPANEIYMYVSGQPVVIELHSEAAPKTVARIKELVKEQFYDGIAFHRVISDFMAQGGDPKGTGEGGSSKPDLPGEFTFHDKGVSGFGTDRSNATIGINGAAIVLTEPSAMQFSRPGGGLQSWLPHCRGTVSMARRSDPNSANSQFFIMFSDDEASALDREYTAWGHVVFGMETVDRFQRGEPPRNPTRISSMRLGTDVPEAKRLALEELSPTSKRMLDVIADVQRREPGYLNACDIEVPVRIAPKAGNASNVPTGGQQ